MSNSMSYAEQEEICYQWLRFRPGLSAAEAARAFVAVFAVTLTRTSFARARARLAELPPRPLTDKQHYVLALGTLFPALPPRAVRAKCRLFFGEDMRDDLVTQWYQQAARAPLARDEAARVVAATEQRGAATTPHFALDEGPETGAAL